MNAVDRLEAIEAISALKARYFRCMDTKDWAGYADVFAPDATMDISDELIEPSDDPVITGNQVIADFVRDQVGHAVTVHHGHMPDLDITSPTTATGIWAMEDHLWWPEGSPIAMLHGYGHYRETYEVVGGEWRIKTMKLTRLRIDVT